MAQGSNTNRNRPVPKKADVILQREKRILANQADILNQIDSALDHIESVKKEGVNTARQRSAIYEALTEDVLSVKQDIKFLAAQAESIFLNVSAQMQKVMKEMEEQLSKIRNAVPVQQVVAAPAEPTEGDSEPAVPQVFNYTVPSNEPDYDKLSSAVVEKIMEALPVQEIANMVASRISVPAPVYQAGENAQPVTVAVDYEKIADIVTEKMANMPAPELDLETDLIAARISEQIVVPQPAAQPSVMPVAAAVPVQTVQTEIDYDKIAQKVAEVIPVQESISADYIASKVSEQIVIPAPVAAPAAAPVYEASAYAAPVQEEMDYEALSDMIAEKVMVAEKLAAAQPQAQQPVYTAPVYTAPVYQTPAEDGVNSEIDYDRLADAVAQRVAASLPAQESVSADYIASKVSEQIVIPSYQASAQAAPVYTTPVYSAPAATAIDYDALADKVASRIRIPQAAATEAVVTAAPEWDYDDIADRVVERVVENLPAVGVAMRIAEAMPAETIASKISDKISAPAQEVELDTDAIAEKISDKIVVPAPVYQPAEGETLPVTIDVDYDRIAATVADRVLESLPAREETAAVDAVSEQTEHAVLDVDYDRIAEIVSETLAEKLANSPVGDEIAATQTEPAALEIEIDYDKLAEEVANRVIESLPARAEAAAADGTYTEQSEPAAFDVDYDRIAEIVSETLEEKLANVPAPEVELDTDGIAEKISDKIVVPAPVYQPAEGETLPVTIDVDYDRIAATVADRVLESLPAQEETAAVDAVSEQTEPAVLDVDYDRIAEIVSETLEEKLANVPAPEVELDTDGIAEKISDKIVVPAPVYQPAEGETLPVTIDVDYDRIAATVADRVLENLPAQEETAAVDAVSEQTEPAALEIEIDYDKLAEEVANRVIESLPARAEAAAADGTYTEQTEPAAFDVDYDRIAEIVSETLEEKLASVPAPEVELDTDGIAEKVSEKISVTAPAYTETSERAVGANYEIDYDAIAQKVAEKLPAAGNNVFAAAAISAGKLDIDEEELADRLALKLGALKAQDFDIMVDDDGCASISKEIEQRLDYDAIAQKVAEAVRASFMDMEVGGAEIDYDEMASRLSETLIPQTVDEDSIADKAAAAISNYLPEVDYEKIANKVSEQLSASSTAPDAEEIADKVVNQMMNSMPAVDEDAITQKVVLGVADSVYGRTDGRFDTVDKGIEEIKSMLTGGIAVKIEDEEGEPPTGEEPLMTVSELVEDEGGTPNPPEDNATVGVAVAHTDEVDEESAEEGLNELIEAEMGGVDFLNMMKFNRSFIARIIQSSDEQKRYYGSIKNRFLSYAKVNSNVSWKNERIYKGRETIARFRIIGKTLCLYLALDPELYPSSVYHQKDVSDNQSMAGTPMMVKVMSDRGLKKALRLVDELLEKRGGIRRNTAERDYAKMYPYETIDELIEDGLVKDMRKGEE